MSKTRPKRKLGTADFLRDYERIWKMLDAYRKRCEDESLDPLASYLGLMSMAELFHVKTHRIYDERTIVKAQQVMRERLDAAMLNALREIKQFETELSRKQRQT